MSAKLPLKGTTTTPLGCTTGWPPSPDGWFAGACAALQVLPPSLEVLISTSLPAFTSSHST